MFMKIFKNLFGNGDKIDVSEISKVEDSKEIALEDCLGKVIYTGDRTATSVSDDTIITITEDITKFKKIEIFAHSGDLDRVSVSVYNPQVNDKFVIEIPHVGGISGVYAYMHQYRQFTITNNTQITYGSARVGNSSLSSSSKGYNAITTSTNLAIDYIVGYK